MDSSYAIQKIWNPDFIKDLRKYLCLSVSQDSLEKVLLVMQKHSPTTYEKFLTLIDRIEFIGHLDLVKKEAIENKYVFSGCEVKGINLDIDSLRLYLSLTCVDILSTNFQPFDKWVVNNCEDFDAQEDIKTFLEKKSMAYREKFQISSNFVKAFKLASNDLQASICSGISIKKGIKSSSEIGQIASYLYRIRNKYTHEGRRFCWHPIKFIRRQTIGPRDSEEMEIQSNYNIVNDILQIAMQQAIRVFENYKKSTSKLLKFEITVES